MKSPVRAPVIVKLVPLPEIVELPWVMVTVPVNGVAV
jgi:hypothetical protein